MFFIVLRPSTKQRQIIFPKWPIFSRFRVLFWVMVKLDAFSSHIKVWKEFLKTGYEYCLVLEDDVVVSSSLRHFLDHLARSSIEADTIRLETYLWKVCLERRVTRRIGNVSLHGLQSTHYGSAAIFWLALRAKAAEWHGSSLLPVDHLLFDPISPFFDKARIFQTMPGLCIQADRMPAEYVASIHESDLKDDRDRRRTAFLGPKKPRKKPRTFAGKIVREATRIANQFKQLIQGKLWTVVPFSRGLPSEKHYLILDSCFFRSTSAAISSANIVIFCGKSGPGSARKDSPPGRSM